MSKVSSIDGYLLGEMSADEAERFEQSMADDPKLREQVGSGRALLGALARMDGEAWSPVPAPPLAIDRAPREQREPKPARDRRSWFAPRMGIALAGAAAFIAVGALGTLAVQRLGDDRGDSATVRLAAVGNLDPSAKGTVRLSADGRTATVDVSGLKPSERDDYYEMWLMNSGSDLVSAGGFRVGADGRAEVKVPMPASMDDYRYFDISLERTGDSPGHSGKSVVRSGPIGGSAIALLAPPAGAGEPTIGRATGQARGV